MLKKFLVKSFICIISILFLSACTPNEIMDNSMENGEANYFFVWIGWLINYAIFIGIPMLISSLGGEYTSEITNTHEHYGSNGKYVGKTEVGTGEYYSGYNDPDVCNNWANAIFLFLPLLIFYIRFFDSNDLDINGIGFTTHSNLNAFIAILLPIVVLVGFYFLCKSKEYYITLIRKYISIGATILLLGFGVIRFGIFLFN